jgi:hypothetical protein
MHMESIVLKILGGARHQGITIGEFLQTFSCQYSNTSTTQMGTLLIFFKTEPEVEVHHNEYCYT